MNRKARRDRVIAAAFASAASVAILASKPLYWGSAICAILLPLGVYPTVANTLALSRGDEPSVPVFSDDEMTKPIGRIGSIVGPLSFAGVVFVIWLAS